MPFCFVCFLKLTGGFMSAQSATVTPISPIKLVDKREVSTIQSTLNIFDMPESDFKQLLERRAKNRINFLSIVKNSLSENDYCTLPARSKGSKPLPTLMKGGGEVVCQILGLTPRINIIESNEAALMVCCELLDENTRIVSMGFGARSYSLDASNGGRNKTIKMAVKSSFLDAVIRAGSLSSLFTMDLEDMQEPKPCTFITPEQVQQIESLLTAHSVDRTRFLNFIKKSCEAKNYPVLTEIAQLPAPLLATILEKIPTTFANTAPN
jgi:hypothetical protein